MNKFIRRTRQLYSLFSRGEFRFDFELLEYEMKNLSWRNRFNIFANGINTVVSSQTVFGYPSIVQIEPTNYCDLKCPLCPTASKKMIRKPHNMSFHLFKNIIDDIGEYLLMIILWGWGEPFLNKEIFKMIRYAVDKDIIVASSTHGNIFTPQTIGDLITSGIDVIYFAVDGATEKVYQRYRRGGSLKKVVKSINLLNTVKIRRGLDKPKIILRFIIMKHNEHQVEDIKKLAKDIGVDYLSLKSVNPSLNGVDQTASYIPLQKKYRRYEYVNDECYIKRFKGRFHCHRPFIRGTILCDGTVVGCDYDFNKSLPLGKVGEEHTFKQVWKGDKFREFRHRFLINMDEMSYCKTCALKGGVLEDCTLEKYAFDETRG